MNVTEGCSGKQIDIQKRIERIINALIINSTALDNIGLMNGKMGIAVFFYHLFRKESNLPYKEFADLLIDEVTQGINEGMPLNFENGLSGICWGMEYLIQNSYIERDSIKILAEADRWIYEKQHNLFNQSFNILDGLGGYIAYLVIRLKSLENDKVQNHFLFKDNIIKCVHDLEHRTKKINEFIEEPEKFDLTWNYPLFLLLLKKIYELDVYNYKAIQLLKGYLSPLSKGYTPKLQLNRWHLAVALYKIEDILPLTGQEKEIKKWVGNLKFEPDKLRLPKNNIFLKEGLAGIAFIFDNLFRYTKQVRFKEMANKIFMEIFSQKEEEPEFAGFNVSKKNRNSGWGVLHGLAGLAWYKT